MIRLANAPVSFGVFEHTIGTVPNIPAPDEVLGAIAHAGYEGTELGPSGYLGDGDTVRARLARFDLDLAGAFIPIRLSEQEHWDDDLAAMESTLDVVAAAGSEATKVVLADAGSPERAAHPGEAIRKRALGLDDGGWRRLADGVERAADLAHRRGFEPTFHHHAATYVEAPWEIDRLLELTEVGLLLDTGHLTIGGGDPLRALREWRSRINHVHVKDVRAPILASVLADRADMAEAWRRGVFCELGTGDVDLVGFLAELSAGGYGGWLVVEQDRIPGPGEEPAAAARAQARNRRWLADHAGL